MLAFFSPCLKVQPRLWHVFACLLRDRAAPTVTFMRPVLGIYLVVVLLLRAARFSKPSWFQQLLRTSSIRQNSATSLQDPSTLRSLSCDLPMATKQVLAATSRARLPPARPAAGVGTPTHSRTHPRLRFYGRASGAGMAVVSLQSLELPSSPATVPSDYAPPRAWRSSPPPRGMLVSGSATYREVQPLLPLRELLGPPGCTDSSAERGFSHGFFLSEFDAFVVHASDCVFHKTFVLCGLLSPSLVVCRVVHLHLLHNITHG